MQFFFSFSPVAWQCQLLEFWLTHSLIYFYFAYKKTEAERVYANSVRTEQRASERQRQDLKPGSLASESLFFIFLCAALLEYLVQFISFWTKYVTVHKELLPSIPHCILTIFLINKIKNKNVKSMHFPSQFRFPSPNPTVIVFTLHKFKWRQVLPDKETVNTSYRQSKHEVHLILWRKYCRRKNYV